MTFSAVTTCNAEGWQAYGKRMAESFGAHWPTEVPFTVYAEGFSPEADLTFVYKQDLPEWHAEFKARNAGNPDAHGRAGRGYDYKRDCVRFSHKVAAITDAAEHMFGGILIWMDADTVTHADVTLEWIAGLLPFGSPLAWLDRQSMYPECGFIVFDVSNPECQALLTKLRSLYESDDVFALAETHDSYVLQRLVWAQGIVPASLSGPARSTAHPLARGPLAEKLDHLKGARKSMGHSPEHRVLG